jgi:hypothetical protein
MRINRSQREGERGVESGTGEREWREGGGEHPSDSLSNADQSRAERGREGSGERREGRESIPLTRFRMRINRAPCDWPAQAQVQEEPPSLSLPMGTFPGPWNVPRAMECSQGHGWMRARGFAARFVAGLAVERVRRRRQPAQRMDTAMDGHRNAELSNADQSFAERGREGNRVTATVGLTG